MLTLEGPLESEDPVRKGLAFIRVAFEVFEREDGALLVGDAHLGHKQLTASTTGCLMQLPRLLVQKARRGHRGYDRGRHHPRTPSMRVSAAAHPSRSPPESHATISGNREERANDRRRRPSGRLYCAALCSHSVLSRHSFSPFSACWLK